MHRPNQGLKPAKKRFGETMSIKRSARASRSDSSRLRAGAIAAALVAAVSAPAMAQTSLNPSVRVSTPLPSNGGSINPVSSVPPLPQPEALVPTGFGMLSWLRDKGIAVLLDNTNEFDGAVSGKDTGAANAGQYGLETDIDWERLAGLRGFSTHTVMVGRYGIPASRMFGDNMNPSQEIYGAGGNVAIHLVYAYGEETLANGRVDIAFGRMPLLNDFAANPLYCNYMNNSFCGNPKPSSENGDFSSYPDASWGIRARVRPTQSTYVQTGLYFTQDNIYQAGNGYRSGFRFDGNIRQPTVPVEVGWEPAFGPDQLPGHYKAGFWYDSNTFSDDYFDVNGSAFAQTGLAARQHKGWAAEYFLADQMILRHGPGATNGLILLAGYFHNDDSSSTRNQWAEVGLIDHGFWKARPQDGIVLGFAWTEVPEGLTKTEELQGALGQPVTGTGGQFYNGYYPGVQTSTMNIEVQYQIHVMRGVTFAPDFQYFIRPNAQANLPDAALIGFKSHIELF